MFVLKVLIQSQIAEFAHRAFGQHPSENTHNELYLNGFLFLRLYALANW